MKLVLHIGTEKTGSTSIQKWLSSNRAVLSRRGVFQSAFLDIPHNRRLAHAFQASADPYPRQYGVRTPELVESYRCRLTHDLEAEVNRAAKDHDRMVVSSEHLQSRLLSADEVAGLGQWLWRVFSEIKVVCYVRHQAEMRRSIYSTLVRQGYSAPIEEFDTDIDEDSLYYNHEALAQRWAAAFGEENLVLHEYAREKLYEHDVTRDFVAKNLTALDLPDLEFAAGDDNAALVQAQIRAYRFVNRWVRYIDRSGNPGRWNARTKRLVDWVLARATAQRDRSVPTIAEREISGAIARRFADSNRRVSEKYFGGTLFEHWATEHVSRAEAATCNAPPKAGASAS